MNLAHTTSSRKAFVAGQIIVICFTKFDLFQHATGGRLLLQVMTHIHEPFLKYLIHQIDIRGLFQ